LCQHERGSRHRRGASGRSATIHRIGAQMRLAQEEEPALIGARNLALYAPIRLANAAYHPLTFLSKEHLAYWDRADFSD
jgi:hypothetical protein